MKNALIGLTFFLSFFSLNAGNSQKLDSLYTALRVAKQDSEIVKTRLSIIKILFKEDTIKGEKEARFLLNKLDQLKDKEIVLKALEKLGYYSYKYQSMFRAKQIMAYGLKKAISYSDKFWIYVFYNQMAEALLDESLSIQAIPYYDSALKYIPRDKSLELANLLMAKGRAHYDNGDYKTAIDFYLQSNEVFEKNNLINDEYARLMHFIGSVFKRQGEHEKALEYYEKELELGKKLESKSILAEANYLCANMYGALGDLDKELEYDRRSLELYKELNRKSSMALIYGNMASVYGERNDFKKAIDYCEKARKIYEEGGNVTKLGFIYYAEGGYYADLGLYSKAIALLTKAYEHYNKTETKRLLYQSSIKRELSYIYENLGDFKAAYYAYHEYRKLNDSLNNLENKKYMDEIETKYQTDKKEQQIALLNKDKEMQASEIEKQATQRKALILVALLVLIIAVGSVIAFLNNRKKSNLLSKQVHEINIQNEIIKEKNKDITDSIMYAKRLQEAVFPHTNDLNNYFADSFILFRPKDIVSGDFYWFEHFGDKTIFIVGDSTGHGVPGAFMSILGHNLLNQIILEEKVIEPGEILTLLDKRVFMALNKKNSDQEYNDGMDIGICQIDHKNKQLKYSGANRPLIIKRDNEIIELKQNKFAIGGIQLSDKKAFTQHDINYVKDDILYLFSDGYYDQFGGPDGKKFKYKKLKELILMNANKSMAEQLEILGKSFENWRGNLEQIDDVCVLGVKL